MAVPAQAQRGLGKKLFVFGFPFSTLLGGAQNMSQGSVDACVGQTLRGLRFPRSTSGPRFAEIDFGDTGDSDGGRA